MSPSYKIDSMRVSVWFEARIGALGLDPASALVASRAQIKLTAVGRANGQSSPITRYLRNRDRTGRHSTNSRISSSRDDRTSRRSPDDERGRNERIPSRFLVL